MNLDDHIYDDPADLKKAIDERNRRRRSRELSDVRKVLSFVEGRRVIWRLMSEAGVFRTPFHASNNQAYFNMGNQNLGFLLLADINEVAPDKYVQMQREQANDLKAEQKVEDTKK